ncbi:hypothetical protein KY285_012372 [Solanum tuberosum]|nr:hypothetical protein KY285_012372 [Solanum tuberosum]
MQNKYNNIKDLKVQSMSLGDVSRLAVETENVMVGHENEFEMMQDQIARGSNELEVVSIVGMGGIGKTTLANKVYSDPFIMSRFDIRAKITVSQEYCARNVLLGLLSSVSGKADELYEQQDDGQLADRLQKLLKGRRYLIVIDDIWTTDSWDDVKLCFPDCDRGSRILMTTRNMEVAEYASSGRGILKRFPPLILPPPDAFPQNLKKLAFAVEGFEHCYVGELVVITSRAFNAYSSNHAEPVGISAKQIQQDIEDNYGASVEVRIS